MKGKLRWMIARWFGRRPDTCWADVVMWAVMKQPLGELPELRGTRGQCERRGEVPYCGKCQSSQDSRD